MAGVKEQACGQGITSLTRQNAEFRVKWPDAGGTHCSEAHTGGPDHSL